jgi:hypothetical protein
MRVNLGQEFVIGGYTPSANNFDAMVIGYYEAGKLIYSARVRNGFTPASRVKSLRGSSHWKLTHAHLPIFLSRRVVDGGPV